MFSYAAQPVCAQPVCAQPVCAQPVYTAPIRPPPLPALFRNRWWESWRWIPIILGAALILFGTAISVTEIVRIIHGVTNRGINNYNQGQNTRFTAGDDSNIFPVNSGQFPQRVEKFHYWPWSYPANFFGLLAILTGIVGILSGFRRSYTTVYLFMTLCLLTALLSGFLIGYYSVLTNYYISRGLNIPSNRPATMNTSFGIIASNLALSIILTLLGILGFLFGLLGIGLFRNKGPSFARDEFPRPMVKNI